MAAWIKVSQTLLDHEKTFILGEQLDLDDPYAAIHVIALWMWAIDHYPSGELPESDKLIAKACRWNGPAEHFVNALLYAGFLDVNARGQRTIHNWDLYAGALIRMRANNKARAQKHRTKKKSWNEYA